MKILYFSKNSSNIFSVILVFMELSTSYVILLHATVLGMTLKGLVSICFQQISFLVGKVYLRKAHPCSHNKK